MSPERALELVGRYARLTKQIKDCKKRISDSLDLCSGISGERQNSYNRETDSKNREIDMHLTQWYTPSREGGYGEDFVYNDIGVFEAEECPHCYAAHLAIQERKAARAQIGHVKAAMSRGGA